MLSGAPSRVTNTSGDGDVHLILRNALKGAPAAPEMAALVLHAMLARRALAHAPLMMAGSTSPSQRAQTQVLIAWVIKSCSGSERLIARRAVIDAPFVVPSSRDAVVRICVIAV